jgi:hypothetical protein
MHDQAGLSRYVEYMKMSLSIMHEYQIEEQGSDILFAHLPWIYLHLFTGMISFPFSRDTNIAITRN